MLTYKLDRDPYDCEVMFTGKLSREIKPGLTILVGCNGSGKTTILEYVNDKYRKNDDYKVFFWSGTKDKRSTKERMLDTQNYDILSQLAFSSEGEEINTNIGILASQIGRSARQHGDKNVIVLLDGLDSGLSIDNIIEIKDFFKTLVIPDVEKDGNKCYVIISANEYELASGERCVDARSGKEISFHSYDDYRKYIVKSRDQKNNRKQTR